MTNPYLFGIVRIWVVLTLTAQCVGCSSQQPSGLLMVSGRVMMDGNPCEFCKVTFWPTSQIDAMPAFGITGSDGTYSLKSGQRRKSVVGRDVHFVDGVGKGIYKVTVGRLMLEDGSVAATVEQMTDPTAVEMIAPAASDINHTKLRAEVSEDKTSFDWSVTALNTARAAR